MQLIRLAALVVLLLLAPAVSYAAMFITPPGVTCSANTQVISPVTGYDFCFDSTLNTLLAWDGTGWRTPPPGQVINAKSDYGATGDGTTDDTAALQAAITAAGGRLIFVPPGTYKVTAALTMTTSTYTTGLRLVGAGMFNTVFSPTIANGALFSLSNGGSTNFPLGGELREFGIVQAGAPSSNHGIELRGQWQIEISQVRIWSMTGDAIRITTTTGDADSTSNLTIRRCHLRQNTGYGVNVNNSSGVNATAFLDLDSNVIIQNTAGGARLQALDFSITRNSFAQNLGDGGLYIRYNGVGNQNARVLLNNFEANSNQHIKIDSLLSGFFGWNNFYHYDDGTGPGYRPTTGIKIGDGTNPVQGATFQGNLVRSTPTNPSSPTTIYVNSAVVTGTRLIDTTWQAFSGANATRFTDAGTLTSIVDDSNFIITGGVTAPRAVIAGTGVTSAGVQLRTNAILRWDVNVPSGSANLVFNDGSADRVTFVSGTNGVYQLQGFLFANIATNLTANGQFGYCSDCTLANPCAGGGTGAFAKRLNGVNVCN